MGLFSKPAPVVEADDEHLYPGHSMEAALVGDRDHVPVDDLAEPGTVDPEAVSEALRLLAELFVKPRPPVTLPHLETAPLGVSRQRRVEQPAHITQTKADSWSVTVHDVTDDRRQLVGRHERRESLRIINRSGGDVLVGPTDDVGNRHSVVVPTGEEFPLDCLGAVWARLPDDAPDGTVRTVTAVQTFYGEVA